MNVINIALRALQFLWTLLIMAIVGNVIHDSFATPSIINYDMFVAVISMLSLFYLIPQAIKESFTIHPLLPLILDIANVLFWFCGAVATAAELGVHSCSNNHYLKNNKVVSGSHDKSDRCKEMQATCAFLFFGFAAFAASTVLSGLGMGGGGGGGSRISKRGPMSQV